MFVNALQGSDTEVDDEVDGSVGPHSFVNHYANVNDTLKQSWAKQKPVKNTPVTYTTQPMPNYSSYTDSEPEATASLSGQGRIVLNNMARSRGNYYKYWILVNYGMYLIDHWNIH